MTLLDQPQILRLRLSQKSRERRSRRMTGFSQRGMSEGKSRSPSGMTTKGDLHTTYRTKCFGLFALPADAVLAVFEQDALGEEVVADGVGAGEVAGLLGLGALGDEGVDVGVGEREGGEELGGDLIHAVFALGPGDGGAGDLGVAVFEDGEDAVEEGEDGEDLGDVAGEQGAGVGGGVGAADELEDGGAGLGGVEVVGERGGEVLAGLERSRLRSRDRGRRRIHP